MQSALPQAKFSTSIEFLSLTCNFLLCCSHTLSLFVLSFFLPVSLRLLFCPSLISSFSPLSVTLPLPFSLSVPVIFLCQAPSCHSWQFFFLHHLLPRAAALIWANYFFSRVNINYWSLGQRMRKDATSCWIILNKHCESSDINSTTCGVVSVQQQSASFTKSLSTAARWRRRNQQHQHTWCQVNWDDN